MSTIHQRISSINLAPRQNAKEYRALYQELKALAEKEDNDQHDVFFRAGETLIRTEDENSRTRFAFHRGPKWGFERASVYQTSKSEGDLGEALYVQQTDSEGRFLQFEHLRETDGQRGFDEGETFVLDTVTNTLFGELP